jgi:hypothetical protein
MPEHRIRFRGGWYLSAAEDEPSNVRRLTLPVVWPPGMVGPFRLTRRFGRPPIDPAVESAWLELSDIPGLRSLQLNGVDLGPIPLDVLDWTVPLTGLLDLRNTLTLELVPGQFSTPEGWGSIALVIASRVREGA